MRKIRGSILLQLTILLTGLEAVISVGYCEDKPSSGGLADAPEPSIQSADALSASWETRTDARSLKLEIPAPRGQIIDRNGIPFAQTRICNYLAVRLPVEPETSESAALEFAREQFDAINKILGTDWDAGEEKLLRHFRQRRWSPMIFSPPLTESQVRKVKPKLGDSVILFPTYCRIYPQRRIASHIIGYTGRKAALSTGEAISGEPLFPFREGRDGLEASFDKQLGGSPGEIHQLYDENGKKLIEEMIRRPVPGNNIVMTLDLGMQKLAEDTLASYCRRGALVVLDVKTGEVLALASRPDYDPNSFVPSIGEEAFAKLRDDPAHPMYPRAFGGVYPPASTYKIVTALAALEEGTVTGTTLIDGPGSMKIGSRRFRNWHTGSEGKIGVQRALARSCNTWFYKVGMKTGADAFSAMSTRLGFGESTGLPLSAEADGFVPTHENMKAKYGHALRDGYMANAAIGQGHVLTSPLQVAQMMAAVANGEYLPSLRLVSRVQDLDGKIVESFPPAPRHPLNISPANLKLVRDGLSDVVNASHGTGKKAANGYHTVAGKTGTGQWGPLDKRQYVAWFAGYVPADNPRYAFAAIYEGRPGQSLSGGKHAAPIVASYFRKFYGGKADALNSAVLASLGHDEDPTSPQTRVASTGETSSMSQRPSTKRTPSRSASKPTPKPVATAAPLPKPKRTILKRLFGKRR